MTSSFPDSIASVRYTAIVSSLSRYADASNGVTLIPLISFRTFKETVCRTVDPADDRASHRLVIVAGQPPLEFVRLIYCVRECQSAFSYVFSPRASLTLEHPTSNIKRIQNNTKYQMPFVRIVRHARGVSDRSCWQVPHPLVQSG